ncbi:MAG: periplasmic heavy metal sensor [Alphaproteobacteria bacterium]|nr:periplasmic heavy metal sensor [Alphaproteobacteria bacterium]
MGKGITIALIASLALNVFAIGFISGRIIKPNHQPSAQTLEAPHHRMDNPRGFMQRAKDLPPESRNAFRHAIRSNIPKLRAQKKEIYKLQRTYYDALRADKWDRATVETALGDLQEARDRGRAMIDEAFLDAVESLDADARAQLLHRAEEDAPHHRKRKHRKKE